MADLDLGMVRPAIVDNLTSTRTDAVLSAKQGKALSTSVQGLEKALGVIVDKDVASSAVPVNGYAYIKNNTHGLAEGLYKNTSSAAFPATGGTANSTVFTAAENVLTELNSMGQRADLGNKQGAGEIALSKPITDFRFIEIKIGYYVSGYATYGRMIVPVSSIVILDDSTYAIPVFTDMNGTFGRTRVYFKTATTAVVQDVSVTGSYTAISGIK